MPTFKYLFIYDVSDVLILMYPNILYHTRK